MDRRQSAGLSGPRHKWGCPRQEFILGRLGAGDCALGKRAATTHIIPMGARRLIGERECNSRGRRPEPK